MLSHSEKIDLNDIQQKIEELTKQSNLMIKAFNKLKTLKYGSIAVMNQIRTVSKMRIINPQINMIFYTISNYQQII